MNQKTKTVEIIRRLLDHDSALTYKELGEFAGVSRQRAAQIVKDHDIPKGHKWDATSRLCLGGCGKRLTYVRNQSGFCSPCSVTAHAFEYRCAQCSTIRVVYGLEASQRRSNSKRKATDLDFCNKVCSGKYFIDKNGSNFVIKGDEEIDTTE